jgi:AAHS family 4-hydroxybenzoate transporter-like MFS transporter
MFVIAVPVIGSIGFAASTSREILLTATFFAGFLVLGIQSGINVLGAMIYPTSLRANGSGWELGIGRIGSIVGPLVGAVLIGLPIERLYLWSALPFLAGAVVCFAIHHLNVARSAARPELRDAQ